MSSMLKDHLICVEQVGTMLVLSESYFVFYLLWYYPVPYQFILWFVCHTFWFLFFFIVLWFRKHWAVALQIQGSPSVQQRGSNKRLRLSLEGKKSYRILPNAEEHSLLLADQIIRWCFAFLLLSVEMHVICWRAW